MLCCLRKKSVVVIFFCLIVFGMFLRTFCWTWVCKTTFVKAGIRARTTLVPDVETILHSLEQFDWCFSLWTVKECSALCSTMIWIWHIWPDPTKVNRVVSEGGASSVMLLIGDCGVTIEDSFIHQGSARTLPFSSCYTCSILLYSMVLNIVFCFKCSGETIFFIMCVLYIRI